MVNIRTEMKMMVDVNYENFNHSDYMEFELEDGIEIDTKDNHVYCGDIKEITSDSVTIYDEELEKSIIVKFEDIHEIFRY